MSSILIVEDDQHVLKKLRNLFSLEMPFATLTTSHKFEEAAPLINLQDFDLIITDMRDGGGVMGDRAGFQLLMHAKRRNPSTQVIVYSGYVDLEKAVDCVRAGCYDYIVKGFNSNEKLIASSKHALRISESLIDRDSLSERLILAEWKLLDETTSSQQKGIALENLCSSLFRSIPGWERIESRVRTKTEEIDLVILNEADSPFWRRYPSFILIECKSWTSTHKPGRDEFDSFYQKIARRGSNECRLGFFVSLKGVASTFHAEIARMAKEPTMIVPLNKEDLWQMICTDDRSRFLTEKISQQVFS